MELTIGGNGGGGDGGGAADPVKDGDTAGFAADVIDASREGPVIVDFWAPWCGPCKTLGPAIEKAVRAAGGAVRLVKINVDENQQLAAQLRVQSIPTVYAFRDGQPVDGFVGAQPDSQIAAFVERLGGKAAADPAEAMLEEADARLADGDAAGAGGIYSRALRASPGNARAASGLVRALVEAGDAAGARKVFDSLDEETAKSGALDGARAALALAERTAGADGAAVESLRARVAADEADHQARFDLALALFGAGDREGAIAELLEIVRRDRAWDDDAARKQLLEFFDAMGAADPLTVGGRRRLSALLFS